MEEVAKRKLPIHGRVVKVLAPFTADRRLIGEIDVDVLADRRRRDDAARKWWRCRADDASPNRRSRAARNPSNSCTRTARSRNLPSSRRTRPACSRRDKPCGERAPSHRRCRFHGLLFRTPKGPVGQADVFACSPAWRTRIVRSCGPRRGRVRARERHANADVRGAEVAVDIAADGDHEALDFEQLLERPFVRRTRDIRTTAKYAALAAYLDSDVVEGAVRQRNDEYVIVLRSFRNDPAALFFDFERRDVAPDGLWLRGVRVRNDGAIDPWIVAIVSPRARLLRHLRRDRELAFVTLAALRSDDRNSASFSFSPSSPSGCESSTEGGKRMPVDAFAPLWSRLHDPSKTAARTTSDAVLTIFYDLDAPFHGHWLARSKAASVRGQFLSSDLRRRYGAATAPQSRSVGR